LSHGLRPCGPRTGSWSNRFLATSLRACWCATQTPISSWPRPQIGRPIERLHGRVVIGSRASCGSAN